MQTLKLLRKPFSYSIKRALKRAKRKKTQGAEEHTRHAIIHAETVCVVYIYIYILINIQVLVKGFTTNW